MKIRKVIVNVYQPEATGGEYSYTFNYPDANIVFRVSQTQQDAPDNCFIKISGVERNTYSVFSNRANKKYKGTQRVEVYYGYDSDMSLVFSGTVDRVTYGFEGGGQVLTMLVTRNARKFSNMIKSISMVGTQSIKDAVEHICKAYGYIPTFGDGEFSAISAGRVCFTTTFDVALKSVLPKDYGFYTKEDEVFVYHKNKSVPREITVWSQNGLLAYPTEDSKQEKTTIKTTLIPSIESGMKINVPIDDVWFASTNTGKYKTYIVNNYTSTFQNGIGVSEFECDGGVGF